MHEVCILKLATFGCSTNQTPQRCFLYTHIAHNVAISSNVCAWSMGGVGAPSSTHADLSCLAMCCAGTGKWHSDDDANVCHPTHTHAHTGGCTDNQTSGACRHIHRPGKVCHFARHLVHQHAGSLLHTTHVFHSCMACGAALLVWMGNQHRATHISMVHTCPATSNSSCNMLCWRCLIMHSTTTCNMAIPR